MVIKQEKKRGMSVKVSIEDYESLAAIAEQIGRDTIFPKPSITSLIDKAIQNYVSQTMNYFNHKTASDAEPTSKNKPNNGQTEE